MKKILLIPFLLFAALSMAACGGGSDEPFTPEQSEQPENPGGGDDSDDNPDTPAPAGTAVTLSFMLPARTIPSVWRN